MHVITIAGLWILIQVVPLIVMFVIYFFFAQQNFFQIEGFGKGSSRVAPLRRIFFSRGSAFDISRISCCDVRSTGRLSRSIGQLGTRLSIGKKHAGNWPL